MNEPPKPPPQCAICNSELEAKAINHGEQLFSCPKHPTFQLFKPIAPKPEPTPTPCPTPSTNS